MRSQTRDRRRTGGTRGCGRDSGDASIAADQLHAHVPEIQQAIAQGSVITVDAVFRRSPRLHALKGDPELSLIPLDNNAGHVVSLLGLSDEASERASDRP